MKASRLVGMGALAFAALGCSGAEAGDWQPAEPGPSTSSGGNAPDGSSAGAKAGTSGSAPSGSGGSGASGGSPNRGKDAGGTSSGPGPSLKSCAVVGETIILDATIGVGSGEVFDGKCQRYEANPNELGDGSQSEGQEPMFELADGATLINVVLGAPAADGIHTQGDATLKNITWEDIGEDAMTLAGAGTVVLDGGSAQKGADKVFQINAESTFKVSNFTAKDAGKFIRQNGKTVFSAKVFIDRCDISDMAEAIFRTDSDSSTVSMTNTRYSGIGESLFIGVADANITIQNNDEY